MQLNDVLMPAFAQNVDFNSEVFKFVLSFKLTNFSGSEFVGFDVLSLKREIRKELKSFNRSQKRQESTDED